MPGGRDYEPQRLKELILYIAERSEDDPSFSKTKLNKLLYYSDFLGFARFGESVTGAAYQRLPLGPCPHQFVPVVEELESEEAATWIHRDYYGRPQERLVARRLADASLFSGAEIAHVNRIIDQFWNMDASSISDHSHRREVGWILAPEDRTEIPYETVFLSSDPPTEGEREWADGVIQTHRESLAGT